MWKIFGTFKLDDWIFFLAGLVAIILSTLGFFVNFKIETTIQVLLGAIGLLITSVVALKSQRHNDIQELKSSINITRNILVSRKDFVPHAKKSIAVAKDFILDTTLNTTLKPFSSSSSPNKPPTFMVNEYHKLISERVFRHEITYKRVEVVFTSERLELTLARLLLHNGHDYLIKHYDPPPTDFCNKKV